MRNAGRGATPRRLDGGTLIAHGEDLSAAANVLAGEIAATIGEVVKRSKFEAIRRVGTATTLSGQDVCLAAESYKRERDRFKKPETSDVHPLVQAADALGEHVGGHIGEAMRIIVDNHPPRTSQ